jgi:PadR family transcriptional regulator PadR
MRVIEPMLLLLLAEEPGHGYRLADNLTEEFGVAELHPQTVYRALQDMETHGWIAATWDTDSGQGPPRKVYEITSEGKAALDAWSTEMEELRQMLDKFLKGYRRIRKS